MTLSPPRSRSSSPLELPTDTLAILNSFLHEQQQAEEEFNAKFNAPAEANSAHEQQMSVADFRRHFKEDWQQSQFWYSEAFSDRFSKALHRLCGPHTKIAFISCPTAYVGFQYEHHVPGARLFEYDTRFRTFAGDAFVHYDLHEPEDNLPQDMLGQTNIAVVDPPFLNRVTNENVARTLKKLMRNDGKLVLLTSTSVRDEVQEVYKNVVGGLKETQIKVEHAGGISNEFACWTNWDGNWQC